MADGNLAEGMDPKSKSSQPRSTSRWVTLYRRTELTIRVRKKSRISISTDGMPAMVKMFSSVETIGPTGLAAGRKTELLTIVDLVD